MNTRFFAQKIILLVMVAVFAGTYVYYGNPVIEQIADYGSSGLNSTDPCNQPGILCCVI